MKWAGMLFAGALMLTTSVAEACTIFFAGKNATTDGSVLVRALHLSVALWNVQNMLLVMQSVTPHICATGLTL